MRVFEVVYTYAIARNSRTGQEFREKMQLSTKGTKNTKGKAEKEEGTRKDWQADRLLVGLFYPFVFFGPFVDYRVLGGEVSTLSISWYAAARISGGKS